MREGMHRFSLSLAAVPWMRHWGGASTRLLKLGSLRQAWRNNCGSAVMRPLDTWAELYPPHPSWLLLNNAQWDHCRFSPGQNVSAIVTGESAKERWANARGGRAWKGHNLRALRQTQLFHQRERERETYISQVPVNPAWMVFLSSIHLTLDHVLRWIDLQDFPHLI